MSSEQYPRVTVHPARKSLVDLVDRAVNRECCVTPNTARFADGEGQAKGVLFDADGHALGDVVDRSGATPAQPRVRLSQIEAVEERPQARIDVIEMAHVAEMAEALLTQAPPEALHLALGGRVVGPRVEQRDTEPAARRAQRVSAIGRAVIQVEGIRFSVDAYCADESPSMSSSRSVGCDSSATR